MDKETQRIAWSCLPKEFKEEVKRMWDVEVDCAIKYKSELHKHRTDLLYELFGEHLHRQSNLTSDAEGEEDEMLCVRRKEVQGLFSACNRYKHKCFIDRDSTNYLDGEMNILTILFGSKCLPDEAQPKQKDCDNPLADKEDCRWRNNGKCAFDSACYFEPLNPQEPKTAESEFKVGDKFRYKKNPGEVYIVDHITNDGKVFYWGKDADGLSKECIVNPDYIELYTEPKEVTKMKPIEYKVRVYIAIEEEENKFRL